MFSKSLIPAFALVASLGFGAAASAQTPVGDITVSDEDLPFVIQHCEALDRANEDAGVGSLPDYEVDTTLELQAGVNLDSILLSDCEEAGLLDDGASGAGPDEVMQ